MFIQFIKHIQFIVIVVVEGQLLECFVGQDSL